MRRSAVPVPVPLWTRLRVMEGEGRVIAGFIVARVIMGEGTVPEFPSVPAAAIVDVDVIVVVDILIAVIAVITKHNVASASADTEMDNLVPLPLPRPRVVPIMQALLLLQCILHPRRSLLLLRIAGAPVFLVHRVSMCVSVLLPFPFRLI
ncbi:hypothetical protein GALMADRAFT_1129369 [Galerina marginata CBS 339.88]|uniref:Uncharacterized protein n=1 Tax=Galerina marginata (strain CBS 339.88) TaxID=685588 RepID=A0A067SK24_GALM3|nr:hypothetical protein GALMADRAFT_1129369 [Galerina marginata CBS 339.88]